ncbi:MAG: Mu transposase C-terminal domain-containing protein, partial [Cloacibacillus sp.]
EELVGDQHIFDYIVLDADGEPIRPEMFVWGDTRSRYLTGVWPVMGHYDKYAVGLSLREACRWGIPQLLHTDWGKPECSKYVQQLRRQLAGFSAFKSGESWMDGELRQYKSKPRNAQAKPIESWFYHAFERPLMQMGLPGYARRSFEEKENEYIQANLRKDIKRQNLLTATEFFEIVFKKVQEWNQHIMSDKSIPEEVFLKGIEAANLYRFDDQSLDFMFLPSEKRKVTKSLVGINIGGFVKKWHSPALTLMNGKTVEVRYNPYDVDQAYILDMNTHELIDIARAWDREDPHDREAYTKKIRIQNAVLKDLCNIGSQLANSTQTRVRRLPSFTPYAEAAADASKRNNIREELVIKGSDVDEKFINLGNPLLKQYYKANKEKLVV